MIDRMDTIGKVAGAVAAVMGLAALVVSQFSGGPAPIVVEIRQGSEPVVDSAAAQTAATDAPSPPSGSTDGTPRAADQTRIVPADTVSPTPDDVEAFRGAALPPVPSLAPIAALSTGLPSWTPERALRITEGQSVTVCPDGQRLSISVAKQGTRADSGIYLIAPQRSGRIEVGDVFLLSDQCSLSLDRTGKTGSYYAEISYVGVVNK